MEQSDPETRDWSLFEENQRGLFGYNRIIAMLVDDPLVRVC